MGFIHWLKYVLFKKGRMKHEQMHTMEIFWSLILKSYPTATLMCNAAISTKKKVDLLLELFFHSCKSKVITKRKAGINVKLSVKKVFNILLVN